MSSILGEDAIEAARARVPEVGLPSDSEQVADDLDDCLFVDPRLENTIRWLRNAERTRPGGLVFGKAVRIDDRLDFRALMFCCTRAEDEGNDRAITLTPHQESDIVNPVTVEVT